MMTEQQTGGEEVSPYEVLAVGYDVVMDYVDYRHWAAHVYELLQRHHPEARALLELGCGTGSLALELQPLGRFAYLGTDRSSTMIRVARRKAQGTPLAFETADYTNYSLDRPVDAALLLYDGLNYALQEEDIRRLFACTNRAVRPGGIFIFDQSTPVNSENNEAGFEDEGEFEGFQYVRRSQYDPGRCLHTTTFTMEIDGRSFTEHHVQRAYAYEEIDALVAASDFEKEAAYDEFTVDPASASSERIHWVLRRPPQT